MITPHMTLQSTRDAHIWASEFGLSSSDEIDNVARWIWENKPYIGCAFAEFESANAEILESEEFWDIANGGR